MLMEETLVQLRLCACPTLLARADEAIEGDCRLPLLTRGSEDGRSRRCGLHRGRRPKASNEGNRAGGTCGGAAGFDLSGLDACCRRHLPAQLLRYGTNVANGGKQLLHHV